MSVSPSTSAAWSGRVPPAGHRDRRPTARFFGIQLGLVLLAAVLLAAVRDTSEALAAPCDPPVSNPIVCENSKAGSPESEWDVGAGDPSIVGFATSISVDQGQTVQFKVKTPSTNYRFDIYRIGYYGGNGARRVATVQPSVPLPQNQPSCLSDPAVGLVDCGNWQVSGSWTVPSNAVSGVYIAKLVREDPEDGRANHIVFIVRDDDGHSDILFQTSDTTWQAYNDYGGSSLYTGSPDGRAYKVSYNRPFNNRTESVIGANQSFFFSAEYPMVRWLEANGYNVSYSTGVDTDRRGQELLEHRAFFSVGHDEYWSAAQRQNVEAARNAGVDLGFFSGNEIFWKTRWESSIDGSGTAYRTLVSYKETHANAKTDPTPTWTGTWRDPRFSPPADGGAPENALTGQLFMVNGVAYWDMTVPAADGKMRFWRNTNIATLSSGQTATLPVGTLGYEWDVAVDNGVQPPGLVRLSTTTHEVSPLLLQDFGSTFGAGTATHNLTLYKHSSGALVFGAGTVQWSWGLDDQHDGPGEPPDARMRQATVNLLADMGIQPGSLQSGLVPATASTDTTRPSSQITSPAAGFNLESGVPVTIRGTASDSGGQVGGVEVSTDNGVTWHPASGRSSWTYTWTPTSLGSATIRTRAVDDSGNVEVPGPGRTGTVNYGDCPCSIWEGNQVPAVLSASDTQAVELGVKFQADVNGWISGVKFYKGPANTGTHTGSLWTNSGELLATGTFTNESSSGWQTLIFPSPIAVVAGQTYVASYHTNTGGYSVTSGQFAASGVDNPPLHALASSTSGGNGVYRYGASGFPSQTYLAGNYWVDVVFDDTLVDAVPPSIAERTPAASATGVSPQVVITAQFTEAIQAGTGSIVVRRPDNSIVAGTSAYDADTKTLSFDPGSALALGMTHTVTVSGALDVAGNAMAPATWTFTTVACPCSVWTATTPVTGANQADFQEVELGVKFRAEIDGYVTGVRFYKTAANTGTHTGSLWTGTGTLLATGTFSGETASGWQELLFPVPVPVTAGTTYVASYHNPEGAYLIQEFQFTAAITRAPLTALQDGSDGGNGVFRYGPTAFPSSTYRASNYWVDVVFSDIYVDPVPPAISSTSPASAAQSVPITATISASFTEPVNAGSISFTLTGPGQASVPATVSYDSANNRATLQPSSPLAMATTYTATISGATDSAGNVMSQTSWSFTTVACPCTIWPASTTPTGDIKADFVPVELGVKFQSDMSGYVTGIRFYKTAANTGTHTGSLWTSSGTLLATGTFTGESASGWQQLAFPEPVAITAGTTYVASYLNPTGNYLSTSGYFTSATPGASQWPLSAPASSQVGGNGVYRYGAGGGFPTSSYQGGNYWVDVVFTPVFTDTAAPTITSREPGPEAASVPASSPVKVTFSEPVNPAALGFTLQRSDGTSVPANVSYDAPTRTAILLPSAQLSLGTSYTATVSGATDSAGNTMPPTSWTFSTVACPCTIWSSTTTPTGSQQSDFQSLELGVKFRSERPGFITGIRFYKTAANTGTHTGSLWTSSGELLATGTFTNESDSGWQQLEFATPVPIAAGTVYVASYFNPTGNYLATGNYFTGGTPGAGQWPLLAPASADVGGNGVYLYGPSGGFPANSYQGGNYWVDTVFTD